MSIKKPFKLQPLDYVVALVVLLVVAGLAREFDPDFGFGFGLGTRAEVALVRSSFRDPDSAQFRGVHVTKGTKDVCGEVNAKNAFGAYTGYKKFVVLGGLVPYVDDDAGSNRGVVLANCN